MPTSSQRDHEEEADAVILVESDDDGDVPDEGEGIDDEPDEADTEGYDGTSYQVINHLLFLFLYYFTYLLFF